MQFSLAVKAVKIIPGWRSSIDLSHVVRAKEEESLSDNFKCRTYARFPYVLRFRDQSLREERSRDPRDVLGRVPGEILSDIYAKVPTNVCRWMDPRSGGNRRVASTSSARLDRILGRLPIFPISWGNPVATEPPFPLPHSAVTPREISQSWIKVLLAYTCLLLPRVTFNSHVFARAGTRDIRTLHTQTVPEVDFLTGKGFFQNSIRSNLRLHNGRILLEHSFSKLFYISHIKYLKDMKIGFNKVLKCDLTTDVCQI